MDEIEEAIDRPPEDSRWKLAQRLNARLWDAIKSAAGKQYRLWSENSIHPNVYYPFNYRLPVYCMWYDVIRPLHGCAAPHEVIHNVYPRFQVGREHGCLSQ